MREKLKMRKWPKTLILIIFVSILISVGAYFFLKRPLEIKECVTGDVWATSLWRVEEPLSYARTENNTLPFEALAYQPSEDIFGASLIQQGDSPHNLWNVSTLHSLRKEITIYKDKEQPLILHFKGKRISEIEWFTNDSENRFNNIGILLVGDVGLDYYNNDTSEPRALFIDIWLDTNPRINEPYHWQGVDNVENDYHSGFPVQTLSEIGKEYEFKFRIDSYIKDSLEEWELERFTLKMVQCYIEVKASKASIEVNRILIGIP